MNSRLSVRILFAGGGTGGHLYPAIAIANRVRELLREKMKVDIAFVGTKRGLEYSLREDLGYPLYLINMRGISRTLTLTNLLVPFLIMLALIQSVMLLKRFRPDLVVGTGGYVSWPVLKMAATLGIITVLQEQNSFPGMATRSAAGNARRIYLGFEDARKYIKADTEMIVTGNPVRSDISGGSRQSAIEKFELNPSKKTILILGGSQGARSINRAVIKSLESKKWAGDAQLLWQTGKREYKEVKERVEQLHSDSTLFPFANEMKDVYAAADIVIARAGALTLAEIIACRKPSILIPYPFAAGDHQRKNAESIARLNAAAVIDNDRLEDTDILLEAEKLLKSEKSEQMKDALTTMTEGRKPAVDAIAEDIVSIIEEAGKAGSES